MAKYVLFYKGGIQPQTDTEKQAVMSAWTDWFTSLGDSVIDAGNPFGPAKTVLPSGAVTDASSGGTGYSVVAADSLDAAVEIAKRCPQLLADGTIEVYETFDVM